MRDVFDVIYFEGIRPMYKEKKPYAVITWVDMNCQTTVYSSKECSTLLTFNPVRFTVEYL